MQTRNTHSASLPIYALSSHTKKQTRSDHFPPLSQLFPTCWSPSTQRPNALSASSRNWGGSVGQNWWETCGSVLSLPQRPCWIQIDHLGLRTHHQEPAREQDEASEVQEGNNWVEGLWEGGTRNGDWGEWPEGWRLICEVSTCRWTRTLFPVGLPHCSRHSLIDSTFWNDGLFICWHFMHAHYFRRLTVNCQLTPEKNLKLTTRFLGRSRCR